MTEEGLSIVVAIVLRPSEVLRTRPSLGQPYIELYQVQEVYKSATLLNKPII